MVSLVTSDCGIGFFYILKPFLQTAEQSSFNTKHKAEETFSISSRLQDTHTHTHLMATFYVNPG